MSNHKAPFVRSLKQVFLWPTVLGILTALGLVIALLEDGGMLEMLSIVALCAPALIMVYIYFFRDFFRQ